VAFKTFVSECKIYLRLRLSRGQNIFMRLKTLVNYLIKKNETDLQNNPQNPYTLYNTGMILEIMGKNEDALRFYEKCIQLDSSFKEAYFKLGFNKYKLGYLDAAEVSYEKALEIDNFYLDAIYQKGLCLVVREYYDRALECFDRVISIDPFYKQAWNDKGIVLVMLGRPEESLQCFDFILSMDPGNKNALYQKGIALEDMGHAGDAKKCFDKAGLYPETFDPEMMEGEDSDENKMSPQEEKDLETKLMELSNYLSN
jgi:tetratricopeptide (TPR) repeat protein